MSARTRWIADAAGTARVGAGLVPALFPVIREIDIPADDPVALLARLARGPFAFLLESAAGGGRHARYTFLGTEPREAWRYAGSRVDRWDAPGRLADDGRDVGPDRAHRRADALAPRPSPARAAHRSSAAPWAFSATTSCAPSSDCPRDHPTTSASRTPSPRRRSRGGPRQDPRSGLHRRERGRSRGRLRCRAWRAVRRGDGPASRTATRASRARACCPPSPSTRTPRRRRRAVPGAPMASWQACGRSRSTSPRATSSRACCHDASRSPVP